MSAIDNVDDELDRQEEAREAEQRTAEVRELQSRVALGDEVLRFLNSNVCRRMESDAAAQRAALLDELIDLDPDDEGERKRMREIRLQAAALEQWKRFLAQYVEEGRNAYAVLYPEPL